MGDCNSKLQNANTEKNQLQVVSTQPYPIPEIRIDTSYLKVDNTTNEHLLNSLRSDEFPAFGNISEENKNRKRNGPGDYQLDTKINKYIKIA
ncbi:unnamed protein product [Caenorhabditis angaria]|uniref:Uncharacterized protein n=1 Tax=Caenorhabditis angaria TaxID=860376 RepID=A0A9P1N7D7_9PELO|nr:unnamed protein product [Caenorhabditis angaria]